MNKLLDAIDKMIDSLKLYREGLMELTSGATLKTPEKLTQNISGPILNNDFEILKDVLFSDKWPAAVNPNLICDINKESDKIERARGIIDLMIEEDLTGKKFLDYGCGEGHTVIEAANDGAIAVGYDINQNFKNLTNSAVLTNDYNLVVEKGPYDVILLYDVLDHAEFDDHPSIRPRLPLADEPTRILTNCYNLLVPGGTIYLRCHPFTSRHASHLYSYGLNKALINLVFNEEELKQLAGDRPIMKTNKVVKPLATYRQWIEESGFKNPEEKIMKDQVEPFFKTPTIVDRILKNTGHTSFPEFQMQQSYVDYVIKKA